MATYDLRKRNPSQIVLPNASAADTTVDPCGTPSKIVIGSTLVVQNSFGNQINTTNYDENSGNESQEQQVTTVISTSSQTDDTEVPPIISMTDFKDVDSDNKLDLLMVAINKMNTNFHVKLDSLNQGLSAEVKNLLP